MLKIGMIGMGGISHVHREAWKRIPEADVIAVCDIRKANADEAAVEMNAKAYYDIDEMLANESFDIVDICLPTFMHADTAVKAMEHGANVITEKPISLKHEDVKRVYGCAEKNGKKVMVAQVLRWWREYEALKDIIDTQKYGKLLSGNMTRLGNTPAQSWDNWMRDPERSGLTPFDLHIHDLDWMVYALGKPQSMTSVRAGRNDQDYFQAIYQYPDFFIIAEAGWFDCGYPFQSAFRFQFENAVVENKGGVCTIYENSGEVRKLTENSFEGDPLYARSASVGDDPYFNEIRYFTDCVLENKSVDKVRPEQIETVLELIGQIAKRN